MRFGIMTGAIMAMASLAGIHAGPSRTRTIGGWRSPRSRYRMPHRGAKEIGKYPPNFPLHGMPYLHRNHKEA